VENELRSSVYTIKDIHYAENVELEIFVEEANKQLFVEWMTELTNGRAEIKEGNTEYLEELIEI
jgi:putative IMPACT (imprinted ancient) family translation regulator